MDRHERDSDRDRDRARDRHRDRDHDRDRHGRDRDRDRERPRDRSRERSRERLKSRDRDIDRGRDHRGSAREGERRRSVTVHMVLKCVRAVTFHVLSVSMPSLHTLQHADPLCSSASCCCSCTGLSHARTTALCRSAAAARTQGMRPMGTLMEKQQQQGRGRRLMRATCRPRHQLQLKRCSPCERSFALPSLYRAMIAPLLCTKIAM